jgi:hypothetical protein
MNACLDHRAFELSESASHLQHQLPARRGRVYGLLIEVQIDPARFQTFNGVEQINQRTAYAIYRPDHDHVEPSALCVLQHLIKAGTILAPLSPANASIAERLDNLPTLASATLVSAAPWFSTVCRSVLTRT